MTRADQPLSAWEPVIGLEVHVQLACASKAFSPSAVQYGADPNSLTDPTVLGLPGALPRYNAHALTLAARLGLAVGAEIRASSRFARKQYFYPDLPKGYQISQFDEPLCHGGEVAFVLRGEPTAVALTRIHLEEDAGKSSHHGATSRVDLNRAGVPLVEVVSEPVMHDAEAAAEYMRALQRLVRWLGVSEADMEKGHLRCDANVSIRRRGDLTLGTRTELKNINSFRFVQKAIEHEIARQIRVVEGGGRVVAETRLWDADRGTSAVMRSKETAADYRYFPDPDLPPLSVEPALREQLRALLPELPMARFARYRATSGLPVDDARQLSSERALADYFDAACAGVPADQHKLIANWVLSELLGRLTESIALAPIAPAALAELVGLIVDQTISGKQAKDVFDEAFRTGAQPRAIVLARGLVQLTDRAQLTALAEELIAAHPGAAAEVRAGKTGRIGFFVGQLMKRTDGKAHPALSAEIFASLLQGA